MNLICTHCDAHYNGVMCKKENTWTSTCPSCNETNIIIPPEAPIIMMYTDAVDPIDPSDKPYKYFTDSLNTDNICDYFAFDTPEEFIKKWKRIVNEPHGMWYWVIDHGECICSGAPDPYDFDIFESHWKLNEKMKRRLRMARWIIDDHGFGGTYYRCSECGTTHCDIFEDIDIDGPCPDCGASINEDENVYMKNGKVEK